MQEEMLKTSWKQRLIIIIIAAILLGSTIAVYVAVIVNSGNSNSSSSNSDIDSIIAEYTAKQEEIANAMSPTYFDQMNGYRSEIKAFNAESANNSGVQTRDIVVGDGAEITEEDNNYYAYYIGYCADESIFDSSFDSSDSPTSLGAPLNVASLSLIEGWTTGMVGAKVGGVRELTIPSELAYQDQEICGAANSPLRFIVMTVTPSDEVLQKYEELDEIYSRYIEAYYSAYLSQLEASSSDASSEDAE